MVLKEILRYPEKIPPDKKYHFVLSGFLTALLYIAIQDVLVASSITLLIGAAKELYYDWYLGKGNSEWMDMLANTVGITAVAIFIVIVELIRIN